MKPDRPVQTPGVGVGAYLIRNNQVLMGYRLSGHAQGAYAPPGGHIEFGETPAEAASREVLEETGLVIDPAEWRLRAVTNDYFAQNHTHYFTFTLVAKCEIGEPRIKEPHKLKSWQWYPLNELPSPLMASVRNAINAGLDLTQNHPVVTNI